MRGRKLRRHGAVHQQRFGGVAGAVFLRLGVVGDAQRQLQVDRVVDIDMAVAVQVLDHRHLGLGADALDQPLAAARDDHVHVLGHGDQAADRRAVGGGHQLHRVGRQAGFDQRGLHQLPQRQVRLQRLGAAAQDAGVAALDGQRRGLDGDVGPALVDHAEHAQRHAHAPDADAAGLALQLADLADRVGHRGDLLAAFGHGVDDLRRELQPVEQRRGQAGGARGLQVLGIGLLQRRRVRAQPRGQAAQRIVLRRGGGRRHGGRRGARGDAHVGHVGRNVGRVHWPRIVPNIVGVAQARSRTHRRGLSWRVAAVPTVNFVRCA